MDCSSYYRDKKGKRTTLKRLTNKCSYVLINLTHYEFMCRAIRKGVVGREDVARLFVPFRGIE